MIPNRGSIRCSSTPTGNIAAPISRSPDQSLDEAQLAKKRHLAAKLLVEAPASACSTSAAAGAGSALYLAEHLRRRRHRRHAVARSNCSSPRERARREAACRTRVEFRLQDYRDIDETVRPHRLGRHVRACRRRPLRRVLPQMRRAAGRRRRDGAAFDRPLGGPRTSPIPGSRKYIFPGGYIPALVGGAAGDRARRPAGHRHRDPAPALRRDAASTGASASSPTARRPQRSTTSASCGCGNSISPARRWRSASRRMMVFQIQLTKRQDAVPLTRDYIAREEARLRELENGAARRRCGSPANSPRALRDCADHSVKQSTSASDAINRVSHGDMSRLRRTRRDSRAAATRPVLRTQSSAGEA